MKRKKEWKEALVGEVAGTKGAKNTRPPPKVEKRKETKRRDIAIEIEGGQKEAISTPITHSYIVDIAPTLHATNFLER